MKYILPFLLLWPLQAFSRPNVINPYEGEWKNIKTETAWMETKPTTYTSTLSITPGSLYETYIKIAINGASACAIEGMANFKGNKISFNSANPTMNLEYSNSDKNNPCKLEIVGNKGTLEIVSESEGCKADCGNGGSFKMKFGK